MDGNIMKHIYDMWVVNICYDIKHDIIVTICYNIMNQMGYTSYTKFMVVVTGYTHNGDHWAAGIILSFLLVFQAYLRRRSHWTVYVFHGWSDTSKT